MTKETFESPALASNLETTAYYYFSKVLSQDQYSIGSEVASFIHDFNSTIDQKLNPNTAVFSLN